MYATVYANWVYNVYKLILYIYHIYHVCQLGAHLPHTHVFIQLRPRQTIACHVYLHIHRYHIYQAYIQISHGHGQTSTNHSFQVNLSLAKYMRKWNIGPPWRASLVTLGAPVAWICAIYIICVTRREAAQCASVHKMEALSERGRAQRWLQLLLLT